MTRARLAGLLLASLGVAAVALGTGRRAESQQGAALTVRRPLLGAVERVSLQHFGETPYLNARDVARLLGASFHWRADLRKLVLRAPEHRLKLTVGLPHVVLDESETFLLPAPTRQAVGEIYVPLALFESVLAGRVVPGARLERGTLVLEGAEPNAGEPRLVHEGGTTRLELPLAQPRAAAVRSARPESFVLRVPGVRLPPIAGDTLPAAGHVRRLRVDRRPEGVEFRIALGPGAGSYRLETEAASGGVRVEFAGGVARSGFVPLAPRRGAAGARRLGLVVVDPGHGGADSGYVAGAGVREKDITLALAHAFRAEMAARNPSIRVELTRDRDRSLPSRERARLANRRHVDLYLSLHVDAAPNTGHGGVTAWVPRPPARDRAVAVGGVSEWTLPVLNSRPATLVPWHRAAARHHGEALLAAETLLAHLAASGYGPTRMRHLAAHPTLGIDGPAVLLECGTLTRKADFDRLTDFVGLRRFAAALAEAVERYAAGGAWR